MKLIDLMEKNLVESDAPLYDASQDTFDRQNILNTRKPKLTIRHIQKLKKIRVIKAFELEKNKDLVGIMYGLPEKDESSF